MKLHLSKPIMLTTAALVALAIGAVILTMRNSPSGRSTAHAAAHQSTPAKTAATNTSTPSNSASSPKSTAAANAPATASPAAETSAACKLLTLTVAQQALGDGAKTSTPTNGAALKTADTSVSTCAYSGADGTVQLVIRTAKDSLGASENATVFGSEKPANAVALQGYGQTAYWSPSDQHLNILAHNNWYIITRSTGTQADAEAIAKQLGSGF